VKPRGSKDNRPVNLELTTIKFPITALASISHRVTGVLLFVSSVLLVWALDASLASEESFNQLVKLLSSTGAKAALWTFLVIFSYHALAGVRHLIMDAGIGEDFKGGALGARLLFIASGLAAVAWGIVLW
jgi:succinate dehydrogenase / fumarate reductase cytochrome b subunit